MIIFDLDGTLANIEHRRHWVDKQQRGKHTNWDKFFAECVNDTPIEPLCKLFKTLHAHHRLQIWSGRSETVYWDTVHWIGAHLFDGDTRWNDPEEAYHYVRLRMRPAGDTSPDVELKARWLDMALAEGETIDYVIDDRQRVVDMWRRRGLLCLQCAAGDY